MNSVYVYRHIRLDTNEVFYVGIGTKRRAYNKNCRSVYWKRITNKVNFKTEILVTNLSWEEACELECLLIESYGRRDLKTGQLINMTNGGEGTLGRIISNKHKEILKKVNTGKKHSKETIQKLKDSHLGIVLSKESIKKRTLTMIDSPKYKKGSSKYKGVSWCKRKNKWRATIRLDSKNQHLGYFDEEYNAYLTYQNVLQRKKQKLINE